MLVPPTATADLLPILTGDIIGAVGDRPGESEQYRAARTEAARTLIQSIEPEDGVEMILAGQMVLLREMMLDASREARWTASPADAYRHRQQTMMNMRLQLSTLREIDRHRSIRRAVVAAKELELQDTAPSRQAVGKTPSPSRARQSADPPLETQTPTPPVPETAIEPRTIANGQHVETEREQAARDSTMQARHSEPPEPSTQSGFERGPSVEAMQPDTDEMVRSIDAMVQRAIMAVGS